MSEGAEVLLVGVVVGDAVTRVTAHILRNALKFTWLVGGMPAKVHDDTNLSKEARHILLHLGWPPSDVKAMKLPQNCCTSAEALGMFLQPELTSRSSTSVGSAAAMLTMMSAHEIIRNKECISKG